MEKFISSRTMLWVFATIGIVAVAIVVIIAMVNPGRKQASQSPANNKPAPAEVVTTQIDPSKLPPLFEANFPVEAGAPILANDLQTASDGRNQATRSFETKKTLAENFKLYSDYFKNNGWIITDTMDQASYKAIGATRGTLSARVSLNDNSVTKKKTVDIFISRVTPQAPVN